MTMINNLQNLSLEQLRVQKRLAQREVSDHPFCPHRRDRLRAVWAAYELAYAAEEEARMQVAVVEIFERDEDHCETTVEWRVNGEHPTGWGEGEQGRLNADYWLRCQQAKGMMCWIERRTITTVTEWRSASPLMGRTVPVPASCE